MVLKSEEQNFTSADKNCAIRDYDECKPSSKNKGGIDDRSKWRVKKENKRNKGKVKSYLNCPISFILLCAFCITEKDVIAIFLKLMGINIVVSILNVFQMYVCVPLCLTCIPYFLLREYFFLKLSWKQLD